MPRNSACTDCAIGRTTGMRCVWGQGPTQAKVLLVGDKLGPHDERVGRPFQGPPGKTLNTALSEAGLRREDVYVSNVVKCKPPQNRTPLQGEVDTCLHYLLDEIETVKPQIIVCLGGLALKALTGQNAIAGVRGKEIPPRRGFYTSATIMATYHPEASFQEPSAYNKMVADLRIVRGMVYGTTPEEVSPHKVTVLLPETPDEDVLAALGTLDPARALFVDLEWTAGKALVGRGIIWPWSHRGEAYSIALTGRIDGQATSVSLSFPVTPAVRAKLQELLLKPLIFHNAMADCLWLDHLGFEYRLRYCTMLFAYLLDETQQLGLEAVASKYADNLVGGWKNHLFAQRPVNDVEWRELLTYGANDTYATMLAFEGEFTALRRLPPQRQEQIRRINDKILMPVTKLLERATLHGLPLDENQLQIELRATRQREAEADARLAALVGITPVQAHRLAMSSDKTVAFVSATFSPIANAQKGTLSELSLTYPAVQAIQDVKAEDKIAGTYLSPWAFLLERQGDGALHSIFKTHGTGTGRLSMDGEGGGTPHTAPRQEWIRRLVRARNGRKIVAGDFSMVELRVLAWIAEERTMLRLFAEGIDLHKATAGYLMAAAALGRVPSMGEWWPTRMEWVDRVQKADRDNAKPVNFGLCYGMQAETLQSYSRESYGVRMSLEQAKAMHQGYFALYSDLPRWHEMKRAYVARTGEDISVFGRRRQYDHTNMNACINTPIQSAASDFTLLALIQIDRAYRAEGLDALIVGTIHDSILVDAADSCVDRAMELMKWNMENVNTEDFGFKIPIPLPADVHVGQTWAG